MPNIAIVLSLMSPRTSFFVKIQFVQTSYNSDLFWDLSAILKIICYFRVFSLSATPIRSLVLNLPSWFLKYSKHEYLTNLSQVSKEKHITLFNNSNIKLDVLLCKKMKLKIICSIKTFVCSITHSILAFYSKAMPSCSKFLIWMDHAVPSVG